MPKLFIADTLLLALTFIGGLYLQSLAIYSNEFLIFIFGLYLLSKIVGYFILPYADFQIFVDELTNSSKIGKFSGYEIFKSSLVALLFICALLLHPGIWIAESILVVLMRVWGRAYISNLEKS